MCECEIMVLHVIAANEIQIKRLLRCPGGLVRLRVEAINSYIRRWCDDLRSVRAAHEAYSWRIEALGSAAQALPDIIISIEKTHPVSLSACDAFHCLVNHTAAKSLVWTICSYVSLQN